MVAPLVLDGPMNQTTFLAYLKECLVPTLKRGDIVIMDSLPVHKVAAVANVIEAAGAQTTLSSQILPGSQPDRTGLQQIQGASATRLPNEPFPRLSRRIGAIVAAFSPQESTNYFRHAGYASK